MSTPKEILTNLLANWDGLSDEAILTALLVVAEKIETRRDAPKAELPSTLGISVVETVGVEDKPG
jgi:hypothetical protein